MQGPAAARLETTMLVAPATLARGAPATMQVPSYHTRAFLDTFGPYHDERRLGPAPKQYSRQATAFISPEQEVRFSGAELPSVA